MNLYTVHQPDDGSFGHEYEYWELVWANSEDDAKRLYVEHYKGQCDPNNDQFGDGVTVEQVDAAKMAGVEPQKQGTHFDGRYSVMREFGWRCDGESSCEVCGRYAMDTPAWRVCDECNTCLECGHAGDCTEGLTA
jgi:hypothetical protein